MRFIIVSPEKREYIDPDTLDQSGLPGVSSDNLAGVLDHLLKPATENPGDIDCKLLGHWTETRILVVGPNDELFRQATSQPWKNITLEMAHLLFWE